jgi:hypothetical protein
MAFLRLWNKEVKIDAKSFGDTQKTYKIDIPKLPDGDEGTFNPLVFEREWSFETTFNIPKPPLRRFLPEQLDLDWPEVSAIYTGGCGAKEDDPVHYDERLNPTTLIFGPCVAHAHKTDCGPISKAICVADKGLIRDKNQQISDIMWHEYGHILTPWDMDIECMGNGDHVVLANRDNDWKVDPTGHGPRWQAMMEKLGKPHIKTARSDIDLRKFDIEGFNPYSI